MRERLLTADGFGILEGPRYLGVHLDPQVLLGRHLLVSLVADSVHPVREGLLDQRERDVEEELAGELGDVLGLGEVLRDVVPLHLLQDQLDLESLVLGSSEVADALARYVFLHNTKRYAKGFCLLFSR